MIIETNVGWSYIDIYKADTKYIIECIDTYSFEKFKLRLNARDAKEVLEKLTDILQK